MLFLLTGDVQIGKTRWLESLVKKLDAAGYPACGMISPGIWIKSSGPWADEHGFEKIGINAVLLPKGEVVPFAKRRDLAMESGEFHADSQSAQAGLGWEISDEAIARANAHFDTLSLGPADFPALLLLDELGRLELLGGKGLTSAVLLLEKGSTMMFPNALVVVRAGLLSVAKERFCNIWGDVAVIAPDYEGESLVWEAL